MALTIAKTAQEVQHRVSSAEEITVIGFFGSFSEKSNQALPHFMDFAKRHDELAAYVVDVAVVKGLHKDFGVESVPTMVTVEKGQVIRQAMGVESADFYERKLLPADAPLLRKGGDKKRAYRSVTVYVSNTCPWCTKVKNFLRANQVRFREVNVSTNPSAAEELVRRSGQTGVPQVDVDGQIVVGFDRNRLNSLLGLRAAAE